MILSTFLAPFLLIGHTKTQKRGLFRRLQDWQEYRRLAQMDDHLLRDVGLTRNQLRAASQVWGVPNTTRT